MANAQSQESSSASSKPVPSWRPNWWDDETYGSTWERVKAAVQRDWEQTRHDLHAGGHELRQGIGDTLAQAAGTEPIPANDGLNPAKVIGTISAAEMPLGYGYGARNQYGAKYRAWDSELEAKLQMEWEGGQPSSRWAEVRDQVKYGFEYKH